MSAFAISCLWCVAQVTLFSVVGIGLSLLVAKRLPALAAAATTATMGVILVSTLLMPMQMPQWSFPSQSSGELQIADSRTTVNDQNLQKPSAGFAIDLMAFVSRTAAVLGNPTSKVPSSHPAFSWFKAILWASILLGMLRLAWAFYAVERIRRRSQPVESELAVVELQQLLQTMSCTQQVELQVSDEVQSAAVLGWLRPLIILPTHWSTWEPSQLRAVLAHELAHVARRDFFWRAIATITWAMHFYHPLAHWLLRRLVYSQEVAADQLAAETVGNRQSYCKALSQLAIRQDDLSRLRAEPILLPTLSSHLIRRITMLRAMECVERGKKHLAIRVTASGLVVLLGVAMIALRGLSQPAEASTNQLTLLSRAPQFPFVDKENDEGVFVIKVAEIFSQESFQPYIPVINQTLAANWERFFSSTETPQLDFEAIEYISGRASVKVTRLGKDSQAEHKNSMVLGGPYAFVHFKHEAPAWKEWVRKYLPGSEEHRIGDSTCIQLPVLPAFGAKPGYVAAYDSKTLIVAQDKATLREVLGKELRQDAMQWNQQWKSLDTGLMTLFSARKGITASLFESEKSDVQALDQVLDNIEHIGYSVDWDDSLGQMAVKLQLYCSDPTIVKTVQKGIREITTIELKRAETRLIELDDLGDVEVAKTKQETSTCKTREDCLKSIDIFKNLQMQTIVHPDGTAAVEVIGTFDFTISKFIQQEFMSSPAEVAQSPTDATAK